ncbi:hypothetical protein RB195_014612 [Necator americanus]|uniref:Uncharacterized protein n=1 Tax=Necator americanus TaxID=51031 RepID=A0ABR1E0T7_NECAM
MWWFVVWGTARAAGHQALKSELAKLCREAIKEDLKEARAEVLAEAARQEKNFDYTRKVGHVIPEIFLREVRRAIMASARVPISEYQHDGVVVRTGIHVATATVTHSTYYALSL